MSDLNTSPEIRSNSGRKWALIGGGLALAGLGLAAGLTLRTPVNIVPNSLAAQTAASAASHNAEAGVKQVAVSKPPKHHTPVRTARADSDSGRYDASPVRSVVSCATCGVVESVQPYEQRGQGSGLGAITGGVLGGAVGNQMGKGSGKTAMTILGALGGGLAGNEIEKRQRSETVYDVRVRMDDGSVRSFTQRSVTAVGTHVVVDGDSFYVGNGTGRPVPYQGQTPG